MNDFSQQEMIRENFAKMARERMERLIVEPHERKAVDQTIALIGRQRTSDLLVSLGGDAAMIEVALDAVRKPADKDHDPFTVEERRALMTVFLVATADEIDRRIPRPAEIAEAIGEETSTECV